MSDSCGDKTDSQTVARHPTPLGPRPPPSHEALPYDPDDSLSLEPPNDIDPSSPQTETTSNIQQPAKIVRLRRPKALQVTATSLGRSSGRRLRAALSDLDADSAAPEPLPHQVQLSYPLSLSFKAYNRSRCLGEQYPPPGSAAMNGMNGGNMAAGMVGPIPAGHQSELSHIYAMVDDLSSQLAENRRVLEEVVSLVGRIRARARHQNLSNQEIVAGADDPVNTENLDRLISILSDTLDRALQDRDANFDLVQQYASVMGNMVRQAHEHKARTVSDVSAWHRSYRQQLAEAREENSRLREQVWDVQERAGKLNEMVRQFRSRYESDPARYEDRVENVALRQEVRFWKRMAMPEVPDDDPMWSDDDDLIDPAETQRLAEMERAAAVMAANQQMVAQQEEEENQLKEDERQAQEASLSGPGQDGTIGPDPSPGHQGYPQGGGVGFAMGGVAMQREGSAS